MRKKRAYLPSVLLVATLLVATLMVSSCTKTPVPSPDNPPNQAQGAAQAQDPVIIRGETTKSATSGGTTGTPAGRRQTLIPVQVAQVRSGTLDVERTTTAVVSPATQSQVAALVAGVVARVLRQPGDWVNAGETIIQLDDTQLGITLANAQASLDSAKINLAAVQQNTSQNNARLELQVKAAQSALDASQRYHDSQKALFDLGGISAYALDQAGSQVASAQVALETARTNLDQNRRGFAATPNQNVESLKVAVLTAQNNLKQAQLNLKNAALRSPFAGQIAAIGVSPGMYVGQNTAAYTIVSGERQLGFAIPPADAPFLPAGKLLRFVSVGASYSVKIRQAPSAPVSGMVPMVAVPVDPLLLPFGSVGSIRYSLSLASGAIVPVQALWTSENRNFVFTVEDGAAIQKTVTIIAESGSRAVVQGINESAVVIVSPPPGLIPGSPVQPITARDRSTEVASPDKTSSDGIPPAAKSAETADTAPGPAAPPAAPGTVPPASGPSTATPPPPGGESRTGGRRPAGASSPTGQP